MTSSVYLAARKHPSCRHLKLLRRQGYSFMVTVKLGITPDAANYIKGEYNDYHGGISYTLAEGVSLVLSMEKAWRAHCGAALGRRRASLRCAGEASEGIQGTRHRVLERGSGGAGGGRGTASTHAHVRAMPLPPWPILDTGR